MGLLDSVIAGIFGLGQQAWSNSYGREEAHKNREFQSDEAEVNRIFQSNEAALQREWSAAEAERARDWQEEMNAKYNSISGKISQAEEAGVNPMFAVTGNAVSPVSASGSVPSGASAGSVGTPSGATATSGLVNILGAMMSARKIESEIAVNESLAYKQQKDAERTEKETPYSVQKLISEIAELDERASLHGAEITNLMHQSNLAIKSLDLTTKQIEHYDAIISKLEAEVNTLDSIRDSEARIKEANAIVSEFEASIAKLTSTIGGEDKASVNDIASAFVKILLSKFGGK